MARTKRPESVRINLEVRPQIRTQLDRLRKSTSSDSITEVIRRALNVYESIVELRKDKSTIILRDKEGKEKEILIIVP